MLINVDETAFNMTSNRDYTWTLKGSEVRKTWKQRLTQVTLIGAITPNGDFYYSLVRGPNNRYSYAIFLRQLSEKLDKDYPSWRQTSILLHDNASFHRQEVVEK